MKNVLIAASVMGFGLAAPVALAEDTNTIKFEYQQYELQNEDTASELYSRLRNEIEAHCDIANGRTTLAMQRAERTCIAEMTEATVQSINSRALTALHTEESESELR